MKNALFAAAAALLFAGCAGGSSSVPPAPAPTVGATTAPKATPSPVASATPVPLSSPTATASAAPTATAVPLSLRVIGGAPTTATVAQLQSAGRTAASARRAQAQGVANGLPLLVESSGMVATWSSDQAIWVTNAQTSANIPETSGTITSSGNLPIDNPGFEPISCVGQATGACILHPTAWTFGTTSANGKPVGQQTISISFSDGTTGSTFDDIYDGWNLPCNAGWAYVNGVPLATTTEAASDVYADCVNGNIDFPKGAIILSQPVADQYGNTATILPQFTAAPVFAAQSGLMPMTAIQSGALLAIQTQDGGYAKVYFENQPGSTAVNAAQGMSLHSQANGSFAF
jgi:hypothetical protein